MTYDSPAALRQALEVRLANQALTDGIDLQRLRRRAAFERLLARLELSTKGLWVVKGGMALELRFGQRARSTKDLDLVLRQVQRDGGAVREGLIGALATDPERDWFEFRVGRSAGLDVDEAGRPGWRVSVAAHLAGREFAMVRVDVVARADEFTLTERVALPGVLAFAGIPPIEVEAVHRVQQFAEKLHALTRTYRGERPSSRVKDLPDLMLLIEDGLRPSAALLDIADNVFATRGTHPVPIDLSDPPVDWEGVYEQLVEDLDISARTVKDAMSELRDFWTSTLACRKRED